MQAYAVDRGVYFAYVPRRKTDLHKGQSLTWCVLALPSSHAFTQAIVTLHFGVQENGKAVTGPDLTVKLNGLTMPNPFVIGSGKLASQ